MTDKTFFVSRCNTEHEPVCTESPNGEKHLLFYNDCVFKRIASLNEKFTDWQLVDLSLCNSPDKIES